MKQPADTKSVGEFACELDDAQGIEQCFRALSGAVEKLGFDGVVYTSIFTQLKPKHPVTPLFLHSDGYDRDFLAHYEQAGFARHDFTIERISWGDLNPMDWWKEEEKGVLSADEKTVIQVARSEYGLRNGISIPTLYSEDRIAGASVISTEARQTSFHRLLDERLQALCRVIRLFHYRVQADPECRKAFLLPFLQELSHSEREILRFMSTGLFLKVAQGKCGITPGYAKNLIAELCKEFNVNGNRLRYLLGLYHITDALQRKLRLIEHHLPSILRILAV